MTQIQSSSFQSIVGSALERMAFVILDPTERAPDQAVAAAHQHAVVAIGDAAPQYHLLVSATDALLAEVAANLLGVDASEVDCPQQREMVVTELANVLGGELAMMLGGVEASPRLGLPELVDAATARAHLRSVDEAPADAAFAFVLGADSGSLVVAAHPA